MLPNDELTGVLNRAAIRARLEEALAGASQVNQSAALVFFDIDRLLRINNTYGHVAGDEVIKGVCQAIVHCFNQPGQVVGRYSGDEFLVIVSGGTPEETSTQADAVRQALEAQPVKINAAGKEVDLAVTVSAGLAFYPKDGATAQELVRQSYEAMLRAKDAGGNQITAFARMEERDSLTGVLTRYALLSQYDKAAEEAEKQRGSVSLISLDVDEFDSVNKHYGRYAGDEVLRRVASILTQNFKDAGVVGRFGGDEFVVVLPGARAEMAFVLAEEVRKAVEDTEITVQVGESKTRLPLRVSAGIAEYPGDAADRVDLFRKADEALYRAKRQGRNRVCLPVSTQMVTKTSHFTQTQLEKLADLAKKTGKSEAFLLREALDELLRRYEKG